MLVVLSVEIQVGWMLAPNGLDREAAVDQATTPPPVLLMSTVIPSHSLLSEFLCAFVSISLTFYASPFGLLHSILLSVCLSVCPFHCLSSQFPLSQCPMFPSYERVARHLFLIPSLHPFACSLSLCSSVCLSLCRRLLGRSSVSLRNLSHRSNTRRDPSNEYEILKASWRPSETLQVNTSS